MLLLKNCKKIFHIELFCLGKKLILSRKRLDYSYEQRVFILQQQSVESIGKAFYFYAATKVKRITSFV